MGRPKASNGKKDGNGANLGFEEKLWQAADKMRGPMDAAEYKHVALGLIFLVLRPKPPLPVEYGYYLAQEEDFRTFAIQNMSGTSGRQRVPAQCFDHYRIIVPSGGVAQAFGSQARAMMAMIRHNSEQSQTLAALRDALLPKLLSREIRVSAAIDLMESAS